MNDNTVLVQIMKLYKEFLWQYSCVGWKYQLIRITGRAITLSNISSFQQTPHNIKRIQNTYKYVNWPTLVNPYDIIEVIEVKAI